VRRIDEHVELSGYDGGRDSEQRTFSVRGPIARNITSICRSCQRKALA